MYCTNVHFDFDYVCHEQCRVNCSSQTGPRQDVVNSAHSWPPLSYFRASSLLVLVFM